MSRKSNQRRTQRRRKAKHASAPSRTPDRRADAAGRLAQAAEEAERSSAVTKEALRTMEGGQVKRMFTRGAKALIASAAIMLMFLAGFLSWSVATATRRQATSDGDGDQQAQVTSTPRQQSATGMPRSGRRILDSVSRFAGFMATPGGMSGLRMFGGHVTAAERDAVEEERTALEKTWQEHADERAEQRKADQQSIAEQLRKDATKGDDGKQDGDAQAKDADDGDEDGSATESKATDQQIQGVIDASRNASGR